MLLNVRSVTGRERLPRVWTFVKRFLHSGFAMGLVASIEKVSVPQITLVGKEAHCWGVPVTETVRNRFGIGVLLGLVSYSTSESNRQIHGDSSLAKMALGPLAPLP